MSSAIKVIRKLAVVDTTNKMTVGFDVGKSMVTFYSEVKGKLSGTSHHEIQAINGESKNTITDLNICFDSLAVFAQQHGYDGLHVVCEPTGSYSEALLRLARQHGFVTSIVSGESVKKSRVIENNDDSTDDIKDPRIIFMLATMGKDLHYRVLPERYAALRELNRLYDDVDDVRSQRKTEVHNLLGRLFCDFPMGKDFIFSPSGKALMENFDCDPYQIAAVSFRKFFSKMRKRCNAIRMESLKKIYEAAQTSVLLLLPEKVIAARAQRLRHAYEMYQQADQKREALKLQLGALYIELRNTPGERVPLHDGKVFKDYHLGRFLGESGPLDDFEESEGKILKYFGLNLRTCDSGKTKSIRRLSKKGRAPGRNVLGKQVFGHIRKWGIFGEYYHSRIGQGVPKLKLFGVLERRLLRILFALGRNRAQFDPNRLSCCESQYNKKAA